MGIGETIIIYFVIGVGVSIALVLRAENASLVRRSYVATIGLIFWPVFVPTLFVARRQSSIESPGETGHESNCFLDRISKIEGELNTLLVNRDGWAERVLATESDKIRSLIAAMRLQALRVTDMAQLLLEMNAKSPVPSIADGEDKEKEPERRHNTDFLRQFHDSAESELWRTIAKTEELISMVYIARFVGGSRSDMNQLLAAISSTVESISAVAGQQF